MSQLRMYRRIYKLLVKHNSFKTCCIEWVLFHILVFFQVFFNIISIGNMKNIRYQEYREYEKIKNIRHIPDEYQECVYFSPSKRPNLLFTTSGRNPVPVRWGH